MPSSSIVITNIGILNAKKQGVKNAKKEAFKMPIFWHFKCQSLCLKRQRKCLSFIKWTLVDNQEVMILESISPTDT